MLIRPLQNQNHSQTTKEETKALDNKWFDRGLTAMNPRSRETCKEPANLYILMRKLWVLSQDHSLFSGKATGKSCIWDICEEEPSFLRICFVFSSKNFRARQGGLAYAYSPSTREAESGGPCRSGITSGYRTRQQLMLWPGKTLQTWHNVTCSVLVRESHKVEKKGENAREKKSYNVLKQVYDLLFGCAHSHPGCAQPTGSRLDAPAGTSLVQPKLWPQAFTFLQVLFKACAGRG